ncbi:MAG: 4Fe-4S ferredoxin [Desulfuromonas sp.]|nr:MAG: 4Fe-4S ferredoxin [Desulfuromonas sp.]
MARYAIVMDTRRCIGCHSCTVACKVHNELPTEMVYNPVVSDGPHGTFPNLSMRFLPLICMHCENSPCVDACPTGASIQREDGIVYVEDKKCVGCLSCVMACPYGARYMNHETGAVNKCNLCMDRVDQGLVPHCVATCHQKARIFGDLDDPTSEVNRLINENNGVQLLGELGTEPHIYYIG